MRRFAIGTFLAVVCGLSGTSSAFGEDEFFERRVRPILASRCVECHGPKLQKGGLRLDSRDGFRKGGTAGPIVVPGDLVSSLLVEAIEYDSDPKMPPKGKLPLEEIEALKTWVKAGANWPDPTVVPAKASGRSWAFAPVTDPSMPKVSDPAWPRTSIDSFILAKLDEKRLKPSPPVDRRTLIRRWSFTLTGLPPTPDEVGAYEADTSPEADGRVVDRLLASPHYGERWARHWLDVARYADTKGYVFFEDANFPWAYTYRDYVIRAFNDDLPYDRFLLEQLAADRLPQTEDRRPLTALGYLTVGNRFMGNIHDIIDDRIDVATRGLLGLTVTCARCHDHKFDPIPTADYYSLYGVFASSVEPNEPPLFEPPPQTDAFKAFSKELAKREAALDDFLAGKFDALISGSKFRAAEYLLAAQAARSRPKTDDFMLLADSNDINPAMISRWRTLLDRTKRGFDPVFTLWHALAELPPGEFAAKSPAIIQGFATDTQRANPLLVRSLIAASPKSIEEVAAIYGRFLYRAEAIGQEADARAALNRRKPKPFDDPAYEGLRDVFRGPDSPSNLVRSAIDNLTLIPDRPSQATLQTLTKSVETWRSTGPGAPPRAMVLVDLPQPVQPRVFLRGNPATLGAAIPKRFLSALSSGDPTPFDQGSGRLELALAIINRNNPLTARVMVNRIWMHHFGTPLVATPGDFGARSDPPSHPELLDHLASAFMNGGWSAKSIHRRLLLSSTFRQAADDRDDARAIDPENRFTWRMNRRRLDWESTRDALLAVSGRLDPGVGGSPMANPFAKDARRRTIYASIDRLNLPGLYRTFDFPDPNASAPERAETSVPPQALFFMNHPLVGESAQAILKRSDVAIESTVDGRLGRCFSILFGRPPSPREVEAARAFLGKTTPTDTIWIELIQALLLSNEFAFVD